MSSVAYGFISQWITASTRSGSSQKAMNSMASAMHHLPVSVSIFTERLCSAKVSPFSPPDRR